MTLELQRDFGERLRLSVHYASTPALNHLQGVHDIQSAPLHRHVIQGVPKRRPKANSVEENSEFSSDDFDLLSSSSSSNSSHYYGSYLKGPPETLPKPKLTPEDSLEVSEADKEAIETCFRGNKTRFVYVCPSMANLYKQDLNSDWKLTYTGIPVLILEANQQFTG